MKKTNLLYGIILLLTTAFMFSCGAEKSKKGNWSKEDKEQFFKDMKTLDLSAFGDKETAWLDCYLSKCENFFSSYNAANKDEENCTKLALECNSELLSGNSTVGNWSDEDVNLFYADIEGLDWTHLGEDKDQWINCYLSKLENHYKSYYEANVDEEGCAKLALECNQEWFESDSVLGNWDEEEKAYLHELLMSMEEFSGLGDYKSDFIDCYVSKLENNYASMYEADMDTEGCAGLSQECMGEIMEN